MTSDGVDRLFAFIEGVWHNTEITDATIHAWRLKLDRYDDDRVMQAVFDLSETERWLPALSQVYQHCVELGRRAAMHLDAATRLELTSAADRDASLPYGARGWCNKCRSALLGYDPPGDTCRNCNPAYLRTSRPPTKATP